MRPRRYVEFQFETPPFLHIAADRILAPLLGPGRFVRLLDAAGLSEGERVLDFGCGGGIAARTIAGRIGPRGTLACVDVSGVWLEICRKRLQGFGSAEFYRGDLRKLPVADAAFDLVFVHRVLRFIQAGERQSMVDCLAEKLVPGGRLLICEKTVPRLGFETHLIRKLAENAALTEAHAALNGAKFTVLFEKPKKAF